MQFFQNTLRAAYFVSQMLHFGRFLAIDNEVLGRPKIDCGYESISLSFSTRSPFSGRLFVKGASRDPNCSKTFANRTDNKDGIRMTVRFATCGMQRERKLRPGPGLEQSLVIVISFHYLFITKLDKAYYIQCFYGAQSTASVTYAFNVSMLPTETINLTNSTGVQCEYEIRKESLDGPLVRFVEVGDRLYHRWRCSGDTKILIRNCFVSDGNAEKFLVVDARGCPVDGTVMPALEYDSSVRSAWVESHAFKFAETTFLTFSCAVRLCSPSNEDCDNVTPPRCFASERKNIRLRDYPVFSETEDEIDVGSSSINVFDSRLYTVSESVVPTSKDINETTGFVDGAFRTETIDRPFSNVEENLCVSKFYFAISMFVVTTVCLMLTLGCLIIFAVYKRSRTVRYIRYR